MALVSIREYSRMRGVSHRAVQKAIESGRIKVSKSEVHGQKIFYFIDPESANVAWAQNTDPGAIKKTAGPVTAPTIEPPRETAATGSMYNQARTINETYKAKLAQLKYEEESGKKIDAEKVKVLFFNKAQTVMQNMLNIPDRISSILAAETNEKSVRDILVYEIRVALTCIADGKVSLEGT